MRTTQPLGTEVLIDPGERGDFYLIQLPLRGAARLACGGEEAEVDPGMLSIDARRAGRTLSVTDVALEHGFVHMGRFAAQYRQRFGCTPSRTLRTA